MKKIFILPVFLIIVFMSVVIFADFEDVSQYPEGKNYIDSSNLYLKDRFVYSDEPLSVKPSTRYTFSISENYVSEDEPFEIIIGLYEGETLIQQVTKDDKTMFFDTSTNRHYFTFWTTSKTNNLSVQYSDNGNYKKNEVLENIQLEEGSQLTAYEPFVKTPDAYSPIFYVLLGAIAVSIIASFAVWYKSFMDNKKVLSKKNLTSKKR
ncbi:MAG: hypothetical protein WC152_05430 [Candidatus Izemoplasmatales bacterium]